MTRSKPCPLVGTWRLRACTWDEGGAPFGEDPKGMLVYTEDGHVIVAIGAAPGEGDAGADPRGGDDRSKAAAFDRFTAYAGRYRLDGDEVHHTVEVCAWPAWIGLTLVRQVGWADGDLVLRAPPTLVDGEWRSTTLVWGRVNPRRR